MEGGKEERKPYKQSLPERTSLFFYLLLKKRNENHFFFFILIAHVVNKIRKTRFLRIFFYLISVYEKYKSNVEIRSFFFSSSNIRIYTRFRALNAIDRNAGKQRESR